MVFCVYAWHQHRDLAAQNLVFGVAEEGRASSVAIYNLPKIALFNNYSLSLKILLTSWAEAIIFNELSFEISEYVVSTMFDLVA